MDGSSLRNLFSDHIFVILTKLSHIVLIIIEQISGIFTHHEISDKLSQVDIKELPKNIHEKYNDSLLALLIYHRGPVYLL